MAAVTYGSLPWVIISRFGHAFEPGGKRAPDSTVFHATGFISFPCLVFGRELVNRVSWLFWGMAVVLGGAAPAPISGQLIINEVLFDLSGVNTNRQVVEIRNEGGSDFHMGPSGYWLYFPAVGGAPPRWQFPPGVVIPAGGVILIHVNSPGASTASEFYTGTSGMRNLRSKDALGLFSENVFGDPSKIVDYVQWGGAGNGGEDVAEDAGIWTVGTFVDTSTLREGSSIAHDGSGHSAADWCVDGSPSIGFANDACTVSYARSPVTVNEVGYVRTGPDAYHLAIELENTADVLEDIGGKWISLGGSHEYRFPTGTLFTQVGPGERVTLHLGTNGVDGALTFYSGAGTFRDLLPVDSVSFHAGKPLADPTLMIDFVQWGGSTSLEATAAAAGVWTSGTAVAAAGRKRRGSFASLGAGSGVSRWVIDNTGTIGEGNDAPPTAPVVMNELLIDPAGSLTGRGWIELRNMLDETVDISRYMLCTESTAAPGTSRCFQVPDGNDLDPGGFLIVQLNRSGIPPAGTIYTGAFQEMSPVSGSFSLFVAPDAADPNNLIDYLRWGSETFGEDVASAVGIWPAGESVSVSEAVDNSSIAYIGGPGSDLNEATAYRIDVSPSSGRDNDEEDRFLPFRRGDCNDDGKVDISDPVALLGVLFLGNRRPLCDDACDSNDSDELDISDPVHTLNYLFQGGSAPPDPGASLCGNDLSPGAELMTCKSFLSCQ